MGQDVLTHSGRDSNSSGHSNCNTRPPICIVVIKSSGTNRGAPADAVQNRPIWGRLGRLWSEIPGNNITRTTVGPVIVHRVSFERQLGALYWLLWFSVTVRNSKERGTTTTGALRKKKQLNPSARGGAVLVRRRVEWSRKQTSRVCSQGHSPRKQ